MLFVEFHGGDVGALDRQVVAGCPCPGLSGTIALVNADGSLFAVEDMPTTARWNGRVKREVDAAGLNHLLQIATLARSLSASASGSGRCRGPDSRACLAWATARASWTGDPAYFSRVFSRVEGLSPRAFRERLVVGPAPPRSGRSR